MGGTVSVSYTHLDVYKRQIYGVVDGLFVSNFVGKTPFAAINLIMPFLMAFGALGFICLLYTSRCV